MVFDAKCLIGCRFDDAIIQSDMKHWPFMVVKDAGKAKVRVEYKGETKVSTQESCHLWF